MKRLFNYILLAILVVMSSCDGNVITSQLEDQTISGTIKVTAYPTLPGHKTIVGVCISANGTNYYLDKYKDYTGKPVILDNQEVWPRAYVKVKGTILNKQQKNMEDYYAFDVHTLTFYEEPAVIDWAPNGYIVIVRFKDSSYGNYIMANNYDKEDKGFREKYSIPDSIFAGLVYSSYKNNINTIQWLKEYLTDLNANKKVIFHSIGNDYYLVDWRAVYVLGGINNPVIIFEPWKELKTWDKQWSYGVKCDTEPLVEVYKKRTGEIADICGISAEEKVRTERWMRMNYYPEVAKTDALLYDKWYDEYIKGLSKLITSGKFRTYFPEKENNLNTEWCSIIPE